MWKYSLIIILLIAFATKTAAQQSDIGNWFIYFGNQLINKKWNLHNEV